MGGEILTQRRRDAECAKGSWKLVRLGELCSKIGSGATPSGGKNAYREDGISLIRSQNVLDFSFSTNGLAFINEEQARKLDGVTVKPKDVLLNITGDSVARVCIVPDSVLPARVNQHVCILRPRENVLDSGFLTATLISIKRQLLLMAGSGATRNALTKGDISELKISLPPLPTQRKIAAVLGALDDKIENNRKICANLEAQAQAIFKSWFVDFEPFGGKMPQEWKILPLESVCFNIRDRVGSEGAKERKVLSAIADGKLVLSEDYFTKQVYSKEIGKYIIVNEGDFAYNPARINIGSIGINDLGVSGCVSPVYVSIRVDKEYRNFFKLFFKTPYFAEEVSRRAIGSVRQLLSYTDFAMISCVYPAREYIQKFNQIYEVIVSGLRTADHESRALAALRDALLPKLMSGEIDVEKVEVA